MSFNGEAMGSNPLSSAIYIYGDTVLQKRDSSLLDSNLLHRSTLVDLSDSVNQDSLYFLNNNSLSPNSNTYIIGDTLIGSAFANDSTLLDTTKKERKPFLDDPIFIKFGDSLVYVPKTKDIFIHKSGDVKYQQNQLGADLMQLNTETKLVHAVGVVSDTLTGEVSRVTFVDGPSNYDMDSIYYNMDSGKALIYGVKTQEGDGFLFGGTVKKMKDNVTHMHGGRYTTCDADCPHFYLQMTKGTVVPGKQTVFGPAYLVFEDVPTPLFVPFGFFPQTRENKSGIIIPEIGEETVKGFFLRNGGYYFALSDYVDLKLTGSIYTLGSWDAAISSNYALRYKFRGSFNFQFAKDIFGEPTSRDYVNTQGIRIQWTHQQDPKFNPNSTFSASVNFTSNASYNKYNANNMNDYLSTQTSSSIAYSKNWVGTPFSISINASHSQNNRDSTISLGLPTMVFNVTRVSPFKRKNPIGKERWYEKISFTYQLDFQNRVNNVKESELFKEEMWNKLQTAAKHTIPISASYNIGGVFSITPSFNYNERWYFKKIDQNWDDDTETVISDTTNGFYRVYDYSASLSLNTKLYGTYTVGTKKPAIFRHVISPSLSVSYAPNFGASQYGFWKDVQTNAEGNTRRYSPYSGQLFGVSPDTQTAALSFGIDNTLEAKIPSSKDTSGYRKIKIIEGLSIRSSYNFLADSLKLAPFNVSLRIPIVKSYTLNLNATLDPYALDENGRRINRFLVQDGGFVRLTSLSFSAGYGFKSKASPNNASASRGGRPAINDPQNNNNGANFNNQLQSDFFAQQAAQEEQLSQIDRARMAAAEYYDFAIPWSLNLNYTFNYTNSNGQPRVLQTINASGSVNLTDKWAVSLSAGYDFSQGVITPGTIQITRDLHCWQMSLSWIPVGFRNSWSFTIQAKSAMLADLL